VLHAVGQGALGVEWRAGDEWAESLLGGIGKGKEARRVRWECVAERGVLRALEGGCSVPVGVECSWEDPPPSSTPSPSSPSAHTPSAIAAGLLTLRSMVVSLDGQECIEGSQTHYVSSDSDAEECAMILYRELVEKGAEKILREITLNRGMIRGLGGA
jgi:hydroxymethylbilane synthase